MSLEISDLDAMYTDDGHYFRVARSALSCIETGLTAAGSPEVGRILDLACGHGRVMRAIRARFPDADITGCDIDEDGVAFCARTFGARPVISDPDPRRIEVGGPFDLVWCGSLLTHVPLDAFGSVLHLVERSLGERGVAVVTVHGRTVAARMSAGVDDYGLGPDTAHQLASAAQWQGFAYRDYPTATAYGISVLTPGWLTGFVVDAFPGLRIVAFMEAAWDGHQDVLVLARDTQGLPRSTRTPTWR